jgi:hypothetical protein
MYTSIGFDFHYWSERSFNSRMRRNGGRDGRGNFIYEFGRRVWRG